MWQTESSGPMVANPYGIALLPKKPGSATIPLPGIEGEVVCSDGKPVPVGVEGVFVCKRPFPGLTPTISRNVDRYVQDYWSRIPSMYYTGDAAMKDEDGYIWFLGRTDEVIKIAGHRMGTIEIESALLQHPNVAEAAVVGRPDELRGEVACAFVVPRGDYEPDEPLEQALKELVRKTLGPVAVMGDSSSQVNFLRLEAARS